MIHDFEPIDITCYRCKICGIKVYSTSDVRDFLLPCPGPSIVKQVEHYAEAVVTHITTGSKTRTDEEVEELLMICRDCEFYDFGKSKCKVCGCRLNKGGAWSNKLRMRSQKCPKGNW